jgi:hypothetical protein
MLLPRDEVAALFAAEVTDDPDLLNAITGVSMWNTWDTLRTPMNLTPDEARATLERTITALLAARRSS